MPRLALRASTRPLLRRVPLLALGFLPAACGHPAERALQGRWFGESVASFEVAEVPAATGWARGLSLEFAGSDLTVGIPAEDARRGRFEVLSANERELLLAVHDAAGQTQKTRLTVTGDRSLEWHVDDRRRVILRRE